MSRTSFAKSLLLGLSALACLLSPLHAGSATKLLQDTYKAKGNSLVVPLYWLPETREAMRRHIPGHDNWVGFEPGIWDSLPGATREQILAEVGTELDKLPPAKIDRTWQRIHRWEKISDQLALLTGFADSHETFLEFAYQDPSLRNAFQWVIDRRPADFDPRHIGATLSSGELSLFFPILTEHLLGLPEAEQLQCFSRLMAQIAAAKATEANAGPR